jgi:hypothetical protein
MRNVMRGVRSVLLAIPVIVFGIASGYAQENFSGNLLLKNTVIKTNSEIIALPKAPTLADAFTYTWVYCFTTPCTLEITMTSELSDISSGVDSLRYFVTVDGGPANVFPTINLGINSTAKTGQIESGTGSWMARNLAIGWHYVHASATVNDTNGDGVVSGYLGDRSLIVRVYSAQ